jgi:hypothetical protein
MNILRNRIPVRKDSPAHFVSLDWRKTILVASQFSAFSHSLGQLRPNPPIDVESASPPITTRSLGRTKSRDGPMRAFSLRKHCRAQR